MRGKKPDGTNIDTVQELRNNAEAMHALATVSVIRRRLAASLGETYEGDRDIYQALGWTKDLDYDNYFQRYSRQAVGYRVITAFPNATWREDPKVYETEDEDNETAFEKDWKELLTNIDVFNACKRVDTVTRIGRFGILLIGFNDGLEMNQPVGVVNGINYLQPFSEKNTQITAYDTDTKSKRFGRPTLYTLTLQDNSTGQKNSPSPSTIPVHFSRVVHVAEDLLESNIFGKPAQEAVYNDLESLEKLTGGAPEMFWRGAFPGLALEMDKDATFTDTAKADLDAEMEKYTHKMSRYLKLKGIKANSLDPQIADPKPTYEVLIQNISAGTSIPGRILTGSERGELASTQDKENWNDRVSERQTNQVEPVLLRPLVEKLIEAKVLSAPGEEGFTIEWPDASALSEKETADIAYTRAQALEKYVVSGSDTLMDPHQFFTKIMGFSDEEAKAMSDEARARTDQERQDVADAQAAALADAEERARIAEKAQGAPPVV